MLVVVVMAFALGWVVIRVRTQMRAVQAIQTRGGLVEYDYKYDAVRNRRLPQGTT